MTKWLNGPGAQNFENSVGEGNRTWQCSKAIYKTRVWPNCQRN